MTVGGGGVAGAHAAVVLSELHVQGAVQTVLAPGEPPPVAADELRQGLGIRRPGHASGSATHSQRPGPPGTVQLRHSRRPPLRSMVSQQSSPSGVKRPPFGIGEDRHHFLVEEALVALDGQDVVGSGRPQRLHDGPPAAGGSIVTRAPSRTLRASRRGRAAISLSLAVHGSRLG